VSFRSSSLPLSPSPSQPASAVSATPFVLSVSLPLSLCLYRLSLR
jgi:hypothetical protein